VRSSRTKLILYFMPLIHTCVGAFTFVCALDVSLQALLIL
jgi:hypothetical protein